MSKLCLSAAALFLAIPFANMQTAKAEVDVEVGVPIVVESEPEVIYEGDVVYYRTHHGGRYYYSSVYDGPYYYTRSYSGPTFSFSFGGGRHHHHQHHRHHR